MKNYAQVNKSTGQLVQFVRFSDSRHLFHHQDANPRDFFVETEHFGDSREFVFAGGEILRIEK